MAVRAGVRRHACGRLLGANPIAGHTQTGVVGQGLGAGLSPYSDLRTSVMQRRAEGEGVATRILALGPHAGERPGIAPTHTQVTIIGLSDVLP